MGQRWNLGVTVGGRNPEPVEVGSLSHSLQGFWHPRWLFGISEPSTVHASNGFWKPVCTRTGVPLVDALMRELFETGFMANRGRASAVETPPVLWYADTLCGCLHALPSTRVRDHEICFNLWKTRVMKSEMTIPYKWDYYRLQKSKSTMPHLEKLYTRSISNAREAFYCGVRLHCSLLLGVLPEHWLASWSWLVWEPPLGSWCVLQLRPGHLGKWTQT